MVQTQFVFNGTVTDYAMPLQRFNVNRWTLCFVLQKAPTSLNVRGQTNGYYKCTCISKHVSTYGLDKEIGLFY